jgi:hypothetical protein
VPAESDRWTRAEVEERTRRWLATRSADGVDEVRALLDPHNRVYDERGEPQQLTRYHFQTLQRKLRIFRWLDRLGFESCIDVGSGWDHYPWLVEQRYGVPALYSDFVHVLNRPWDGSWGKLDRAVTLNVGRLPFPDGAFDVVLCSEVLEHLVRPVEAIAELLRITRRALVLTSLEALSAGRLRRWWSHHRVDVRVPHVERNFFLLHEVRALFGADVHTENLFYESTLPVSPFAPEAAQQAAYGTIRTRTALVEALCRAVAVDGHGPGAMGMLVVKTMPGTSIAPPRPGGDAELARWLVEQAAAFEPRIVDLVFRIGEGRAELVPPDRPVAPSLLARVRCPDCTGALRSDAAGLACMRCAARFAAEYGVPILHPSRAPDGGEDEAASLARLCGSDTARRRIVRRVLRRLRRNERPPGALRRALWRLEGP